MTQTRTAEVVQIRTADGVESRTADGEHSHVFLGHAHERNERRAWLVIGLCTVMMVLEIAGGTVFGSIALVADGLHMSTHAGALLLAALAYSFARKYARDPRFTFGTGKLGDLTGFASALVLAMISLLIGWEAVERLLAPVPIKFWEAFPIACLGLVVNVASALLLSGGHHHHHGAHAHGHGGHAHHHEHEHEHDHDHEHAHDHDHDHDHDHEHAHHGHHHDNNMRAALVHVAADAAVSVLVIAGLVLGQMFGWRWTDPVVGVLGAVVIAVWALGLVRDTGAILLDMNPDRRLAERIRQTIEGGGDRVVDLHLWRLGPGHLGAILAVRTRGPNDGGYYRAQLKCFSAISHLTVEVLRDAA
jgi:cation diffusion facilitator family transporter